MMKIALADREAQLMDALWDNGPSSVSEVQATLHDEPAYNTVLTMLRKLEAKGYVGHTEEGRAFRYHALIERGAAQQGAIEAVISRLFKGSTDALLTHMATRENLTSTQIKRVEDLLLKRRSRKKRT
jgi:predicted transcriptional regulator